MHKAIILDTGNGHLPEVHLFFRVNAPHASAVGAHSWSVGSSCMRAHEHGKAMGKEHHDSPQPSLLTEHSLTPPCVSTALLPSPWVKCAKGHMQCMKITFVPNRVGGQALTQLGGTGLFTGAAPKTTFKK